MKIVYNNIIPFKGFKAMNILGLLFVRKKFKPIDKITINHERIHTAQMRELLYIFFYLFYGVEYLFKLFKYSPHKAYRNISFEREAYSNEGDLTYLKGRKLFSQWR